MHTPPGDTVRLMRERTFIRTMLSAAAALVALSLSPAHVGAAAPPAPTEASDSETPVLLKTVTSTRRFSPNGDGVRDKVRVGIRLARAATISVTVVRDGSDEVLRQETLARVRAGKRVWAWDGRNQRGRVVRDGKYVIRVTARGSRDLADRDQAGTRVSLRTLYTPLTFAESAPRLEVSRTTIYPATQDFQDAIQVSAYEFWPTWDPFGGGRGIARTPPMEMLDSAGRRVPGWSTDQPAWEPRKWTASTSDGDPLPQGQYTLVTTFTDPYGNTKRTRRRIEVSRSPLVAQQTWSSSLAAADALTSDTEWYAHCKHDCIYTCSPSPSVRTMGALTLRSPEALARSSRYCMSSAGTFAADVPFEPGELDRISVTTSGSWHPAASTGSALVALSSVTSGAVAEVFSGTNRATVGPAFHDGTGSTAQVRWSVDGGRLQQTEWDLETFDVQVVRYAPAP